MLEEELLTPKALDSTVRYCLNQVGLGGMWGMCFIFEEVFIVFIFLFTFCFSDLFNGVPCASDGECAYLGTTCNFVEGVCHVKSLAEVEVEYVKCYLETISSSVEVTEKD